MFENRASLVHYWHYQKKKDQYPLGRGEIVKTHFEDWDIAE